MDIDEPGVSQSLEAQFRERFGLEPAAFVGLALEEAQAMAVDRVALIRVLSEDGRFCGRTDDCVKRRVNVDVSDGTIIRVDGVY